MGGADAAVKGLGMWTPVQAAQRPQHHSVTINRASSVCDLHWLLYAEGRGGILHVPNKQTILNLVCADGAFT